ncbi:MAG: hypothetical protein RXQ80_08980 [Sulfolobaceae archaeon]
MLESIKPMSKSQRNYLTHLLAPDADIITVVEFLQKRKSLI